MFRIFVFILAAVLGLGLVQGHALDGSDETKMHPSFNRKHAAGKNVVYEDEDHWIQSAQDMLKSKIKDGMIEGKAKNIVFFLGDGMSVATVTAARILKGQMEGSLIGGEEADLHFDTFPHIGVSKTFCTDTQVADSACTATAYLCGIKANDGTIGVKSNVELGANCAKQMDTNNHVSSVLQWAQAAGKSTGVVTTTRVTHASPAGTYAHIAHRDWENDAIMKEQGQDPDTCDDIAEQLILNDPGKNIDVILGGGRREFTPNNFPDVEVNTTFGKRADGKNLIEHWKDMNNNDESKVIYYLDELLAIDTAKVNKVLGLFSSDHIAYLDKQPQDKDPSIEQMTRVAIQILSKNPNGFFLFVEGGRIDHAHHDGFAKRALLETIEFDKAIETADKMTDDEDTLIVVTSDHSHTMTINGYPKRGNPILGVVGVNADDDLPYSTISYANGPGYRLHKIIGENATRFNISDSGEDLDNVLYRQIATVPLAYESHGGDDVLIFSKGPFAHFLTGVQQQSYIPHVVGYAACMGGGARFSGCGSSAAASIQHGSIILALLFLSVVFRFTNLN